MVEKIRLPTGKDIGFVRGMAWVQTNYGCFHQQL